MLCCVTFHPLSVLISYSAVVTALDPILTVGMLAIGLAPLGCYFYQATSTDPLKVRSQNCGNHESGLAVGTMGAAQILSVHAHKSTVAKLRPILAARALDDCSDVLQGMRFKLDSLW